MFSLLFSLMWISNVELDLKMLCFLFFGKCCEGLAEFPATCVDFRTNFDRLMSRNVLIGSII